MKIKIKTSELTGSALDWAVAKADDEKDVLFCQRQYGRLLVRVPGNHETPDVEWLYSPSAKWDQGGPIIECEEICLISDASRWAAASINYEDTTAQEGKTPLIAAMRCYVASKLGGEIEIPAELLDII